MSDHHVEFPPDDLDPSCPPRSVLVLYATETGTAQDAAHRVSRHCRRLHFHTRVLSIDAYPLEELVSESLVLFIVSTTGAGKEPRSLTPLWTTLLRSDLPEDLFDELHFSVFGLGDTAYEKFCWPAKLLERRLESLGGQVICERGDGDEQHRIGIDGALLPWMRQLEERFQELYPLTEDYHEDHYPSEHGLAPPRVVISNASSSRSNTHQLEEPFLQSPGNYLATVSTNRRITAKAWEQDVRHFELYFTENIQYSPGDVAVIHPQAASEDVDAFLISMGWANTADDLVVVNPSSPSEYLPAQLPSSTTLRAIFTQYLDFNAVPRRSFFELVRHFAQDDVERDKLTEFCQEDGDGADDMYDYCTRMRRTIREVLDDFHSVRIPREYIFDVFPPMRTRSFSIASSIKRHPRQVHLCVAIVRYRTKLKIARKGVCTSYMASWRPGQKVVIGLQKGLMSLPPSPETPIICVGPGTGIAPMRALIEERIALGGTSNTLYFGCRSAAMDQHYAEDWAAYAREGNLEYRLAPSRDGPDGVARIYVQHLIEKDAKRICELVTERGAWVYISGSSNKMPLAVKAAVQNAVEREGGRAEEDAKEFIRTLEKDGRLLEECWS